MFITDYWYEDECGKAVYCTVQIGNDELVDVVYPNCSINSSFLDSFCYVMDCCSGGNVYSHETNSDGIGIRTLSDTENNDIIQYVSENLSDYINEN